MFCRSLFFYLYFFFWQLCCLLIFDIRILIAPFGIFRQCTYIVYLFSLNPVIIPCIATNFGLKNTTSQTLTSSVPHSWYVGWSMSDERKNTRSMLHGELPMMRLWRCGILLFLIIIQTFMQILNSRFIFVCRLKILVLKRKGTESYEQV